MKEYRLTKLDKKEKKDKVDDKSNHGDNPFTDVESAPIAFVQKALAWVKEALELEEETDPVEPSFNSHADIKDWMEWLDSQCTDSTLGELLKKNCVKSRGSTKTKMQALILCTINNLK